ncbi:MAG: HD family hydrolase [Bradymonadaceae bacterium]|nr:HD family hydrolase [Lujinxingiaceae bacterium]
MTEHDDDSTLAAPDELSKQAKHLLRLVSRAERLEALPRTGWIVCGVQNPESVAAHSYMVAIIAMWIADQLAEPIDMAFLLRIALLHDIGEAVLTDLPWPVKRFVGSEVLAEAEQRAVDLVLEDSPASWRQAFGAYVERGSIEARIVKAADQIQMLAKACQYASQHRGDTERFWHVARNFDDHGIALVASVFEELSRHHKDGSWFLANFD